MTLDLVVGLVCVVAVWVAALEVRSLVLTARGRRPLPPQYRKDD